MTRPLGPRFALNQDHCPLCGMSGLDILRGLHKNCVPQFRDMSILPTGPVAEQVAESPVADCKCGHPASAHYVVAANARGPCQDVSCPCTAFRAAESKLSKSTRCYACGMAAHATGFCPYVKRGGRER